MKARYCLLFITLLLLYGTPRQSIYISSAKAEPKKDVRAAQLAVFFKRFHSPLESLSGVFIREADRNHLDWRLLPSIACAESSCGKHYSLNAFGWGSDKIDYGSDTQDIKQIAKRIAENRPYGLYRKSKSLRDFSQAYNGPEVDSYIKTIQYFYEKI